MYAKVYKWQYEFENNGTCKYVLGDLSFSVSNRKFAIENDAVKFMWFIANRIN